MSKFDRGFAGRGFALLKIVQGALGSLHIRRPQHHETVFRTDRCRQVGIFDVDAGRGEAIRDDAEGSRLIIALDHQHFVFESQDAALAQNHKGLGRIAHHHAHDRVIDRVGGGKGVNIDLRLRELGADPGESAGAIAKKNGELGSSLDLDLRSHIPILPPARRLTI